MERAFQTAMTIHSPDVAFVLGNLEHSPANVISLFSPFFLCVYIGDLFDEGKWCSDAEFQDYIHRFEQMFRVPGNTQMQVVVGNHDIGFHYM
jgi:metallophosphoesterase superfamily enzyme